MCAVEVYDIDFKRTRFSCSKRYFLDKDLAEEYKINIFNTKIGDYKVEMFHITFCETDHPDACILCDAKLMNRSKLLGLNR